jgi:hypothetical protein
VWLRIAKSSYLTEQPSLRLIEPSRTESIQIKSPLRVYARARVRVRACACACVRFEAPAVRSGLAGVGAVQQRVA